MSDATQGTPEWKALRLGKVTASRIADVVAKTKSGYSASRANYAAELIAERLTGSPTEKFVSDAMRHGTEHEDQARATYELTNDVTVTPVGFVPHPHITMAGASPDGLVGDDGLVEIKCPGIAKHIETLLNDTIDGKYIKQMQWQMACTGRAWCDFVSFNPALPFEMQLWTKRIARDAKLVTELETEAETFLDEIDATLAQLTAKFSAAQVAA